MSKLRSAIIDLIRMRTQEGDPSAPPSGFGYFFEKLLKPFYMNSNGEVFDLTVGSSSATPAVQITEASGPTTLNVGAFNDGQFLKRSGDQIISEGLPVVHYILAKEEQPTGTDGGDFAPGSWIERVLNVIKVDTGGLCALDGNGISIPAGTYRYIASAPANGVEGHQMRLHNYYASASIDGSNGTSENSTGATTRSIAKGQFTVSEQTTITIEHYGNLEQLTIGLGQSVDSGDPEVYSMIELWKVA